MPRLLDVLLAAALRAALLHSAALVLSCASGAVPDGAAGAAAEQEGPWILRGAEPQRVPALLRSTPVRVLRLAVGDVTNPRRVSLTLLVTAAQGGTRYDVARFSFFPPDRGGSFMARLPEPLARALATQPSVPFTCVLTTEPGVSLAGVQARLQALELVAEP